MTSKLPSGYITQLACVSDNDDPVPVYDIKDCSEDPSQVFMQ